MTRPFRGIRAYDGGFRRALPCPPDVTFCVTASVLPPLNFRELMNSLSEPHTVRVLRRALSSTLGASPMQVTLGWHWAAGRGLQLACACKLCLYMLSVLRLYLPCIDETVEQTVRIIAHLNNRRCSSWGMSS